MWITRSWRRRAASSSRAIFSSTCLSLMPGVAAMLSCCRSSGRSAVRAGSIVSAKVCSHPLDDVQAAMAIDQVHEPAVVVADVVAAHAIGALGYRRHERRHLARGVRLADVHD